MVAACTLFTPFGTDLTSGDPIVIEAGAPDGSMTVNDGESNVPVDGGQLPDGTAIGDAAIDAGPTACKQKGDVVHPIRAFNATPSGVGGALPICNVEAVLAEDGIVAGLDRAGDDYQSVDGQGIVSCIGVEMAPGVVMDRVIVRAASVGSACGISACDPAAATGCGTGHSFPIYVGATETEMKMAVNGNDVSKTLSTIDIPVAAEVTARFVFVCRSTWGLERDDIAIDSISAICR